jgi:hypothetical protein
MEGPNRGNASVVAGAEECSRTTQKQRCLRPSGPAISTRWARRLSEPHRRSARGSRSNILFSRVLRELRGVSPGAWNCSTSSGAMSCWWRRGDRSSRRRDPPGMRQPAGSVTCPELPRWRDRSDRCGGEYRPQRPHRRLGRPSCLRAGELLAAIERAGAVGFAGKARAGSASDGWRRGFETALANFGNSWREVPEMPHIGAHPLASRRRAQIAPPRNPLQID